MESIIKCIKYIYTYIDGGAYNRDRSGAGYNQGPYDRPGGYINEGEPCSSSSSSRGFRGEPSSGGPRVRTVKEAMESNVLLTRDQYLDMEDVSLTGEPVEVQDQAYEVYKENHRRVALERFFLGHKDEAW